MGMAFTLAGAVFFVGLVILSLFFGGANGRP